jgi:ADP-ribose pyrophosphatase YjhB (NUDIX family)
MNHPDIKVRIATGSVIASLPHDPFVILAGTSEKHGGLLVIPGGKLERTPRRWWKVWQWLSGSDSERAVSCARREFKEETGAEIGTLRLLGVATDPERDVRHVPLSKIATAAVFPSLAELGLDPETSGDFIVEAHYGAPDFIFGGTCPRIDFHRHDLELGNLRTYDLRNLRLSDFSAGHGVVVATYKKMLLDGQSRFSEESLQDFAADEAELRDLFRS